MRKGWLIAGIALAVLAVVAIGLLIAGGVWARGHGGFAFHPMMRWDGPFRAARMAGGGWMALPVLALAAGAIAVLVAALPGRKEAPRAGEPTPLDILKRRYASGELNREEFERMRDEIK